MTTKANFPSGREYIERPLPHSIQAEREILGAIVLQNEAMLKVLPILRDSDFYLPQNQRIYKAMEFLVSSGKPIDSVSVLTRLEAVGELDAAGGVEYLSQLADGIPNARHVEHHATIVREHATRRRAIHIGQALYDRAFDCTRNLDESFTLAETQLRELRERSSGSDLDSLFHNYEEFEKAPPLSFAITGILQNDGATLIGGPSGHGKTFILLSIVKALLRGSETKLWDYFDVIENDARVIYLVPECAISPFGHRLKLFGLFEYVKSGRLLVRTLSKGPTPCLSDPRILRAAKGCHVILDTAVRFQTEGDENAASDNQRGLATDIFALLGAGAKNVIGAHHSPKSFARENVMTLETVLRGSGDIGAMLATAWGVKQLDAERNIVHVQNLKPRDFQPPEPFQLIARPYITDEGDFRMHKRPGECGVLMDEQQPERDKGGAPSQVREARAANIQLLREWLEQNPSQTSDQLVERFTNAGINVARSTVRKYKMELGL